MHRVTPRYFVVIFRIEYIHPLSPECATVFANLCNSITRQPIELESCSNPLRIQQVFWLSSKKKFFVLDLGFSGGKVESWGVYAFLLAASTWPWSPIHCAIFWFKLFWKLGQNPRSIEPFHGFLAFLEPKLWIKKQKLVKIWGGLHPFSKWSLLTSRLR